MAERLIVTFLASIPISGMIGVGLFMMVSAVTGKGVRDPGPQAGLQMRIQYKIRGIIGLAFTIGGGVMFYGLLLSSC